MLKKGLKKQKKENGTRSVNGLLPHGIFGGRKSHAHCRRERLFCAMMSSPLSLASVSLPQTTVQMGYFVVLSIKRILSI